MEKFKLPEPFRTDWINALRSGEYKQGKSCLYSQRNDSYCCLGVAEKICGNNLENIKGYGYPSQVAGSKVPLLLKVIGQRETLADIVSRMNDAQNDFNKIADWLEENTESE